MRTGGWLMLLFSWGVILALLIYSFVRILGEKEKAADSGDDMSKKIQ
ncbi:MAG: hypothetical protein NTV06_01065 [candidate division Zixibacteria bacterium]|nr:hypothetical protein [candidate division Zixibacteria bacterium]